MHIRINKFDEKYNNILILFKISDVNTKYISVGIITEWCLQFCLCPRRRREASKILPREKIKESIYEVGSRFASEWLYEAINNWLIVTYNGIPVKV